MGILHMINAYSVSSNERINVAHLELALRLPMEYIPDPRTVIEDAADKEKEERDALERQKVCHYMFITFSENKKRRW